MTRSASPTPWNAPAMNGLSSTALQKTTSFAQPKPSRSRVSSAASFTICPMRRTASMLMPAFVVATLTLAQTTIRLGQRARDGGDAAAGRPAVQPLWTSAENPPIKSTPQVFAARVHRASANGDIVLRLACRRRRAQMGVTEMRLLTIGMPSSRSIWHRRWARGFPPSGRSCRKFSAHSALRSGPRSRAGRCPS